MMSRPLRRLAFPCAGLLLAGTVSVLKGCDCNDGAANPPTYSCQAEGGRPGADVDEPCGAGKRFALGRCLELRCDPDDLCCPGLFCTGGGTCEMPPTYFQTCTTDGECGEGQRCLARPLVAETPTCGYDRIVDGRCGGGAQPWGGRCVAAAPCGGNCPPGQVCNIDLIHTNADGMPAGGRCERTPPLSTGCDQTCGEAQLLVYADPDAMLFDQCCDVTCECLTLPPLLAGRWGRFSDLVLGPTDLFISAYDGTYGDLVMGRHGRLSGQLDDLAYIDGVPAGGTIVADPSGPRGGRDDPGPNVGAYTSIALQNNTPRIAYYDLETLDLKYAAFDAGSGQWTLSLIDDGRDGAAAGDDVGRFASLLIDAAGIAHVTYYAHRTSVGGATATTPMYARALSEAPAGYDDWERVPIDPVSECPVACADTEICVDNGAADPECLPARDDCDPGCGCGDACAEVGGQPACRREMPDSLDGPCGGSCPDGKVCVADLTGGDSICLDDRDGDCTGESSCASGQLCVDDGSGNAVCRLETPFSRIEGMPEGNGLFTDLAVFNNRATVVYYDRLRGVLRGAQANFDITATATDFSTVAIACGGDDGRFPSLAVTADGAEIAVAYQAQGGAILEYRRADDFVAGLAAAPPEVVDDGRRGTQVNLVGASASLAFDEVTNEALIAYQDQTDNDLLLGYTRNGLWRNLANDEPYRVTLLSEGAYGSFARLVVGGARAWVSNYRRARDAQNQDASELVVHIVDLSTLP